MAKAVGHNTTWENYKALVNPLPASMLFTLTRQQLQQHLLMPVGWNLSYFSQEVGLWNGSPGTVISLLFPDGQGPPNLPIPVLAHFSNYGIQQHPCLHTSPTCNFRVELRKSAPFLPTATPPSPLGPDNPQVTRTDTLQGSHQHWNI